MKVKYLDYGFVELIDSMGDDNAIADSARMSYSGNISSKGNGKTNSSNEGLIRYLMRARHTSPFEQVELKFHIRLPIFIMRQLVRHRTASLNEWSGRYSEMPPEFYVPPIKRMKFQSTSNKQMSGDSIPEDVASIMQGTMEMVNEDAYRAYEDLLANGLSKELARLVLPVSNYTEIVWKINLHNFLHFTKLRNDPNHAQDEIVTLSRIMYEMVKKKVPIACKAWEDYVHNAITFSAIEQRVIMGIFNALANEKIDESALNEWINEFADEEELNITEREKRELIPKLIKIIS